MQTCFILEDSQMFATRLHTLICEIKLGNNKILRLVNCLFADSPVMNRLNA
jgi:hypothetical protein